MERKRNQSRESTQDEERPSSVGFKPMETQEGVEEDVTIEPTQIQNRVVPYPKISHDSIRVPSNQWNVVIPVREGRTRGGKVKRPRNPFDKTRGTEAWKIRQEKAIARANYEKSKDHIPNYGSSRDHQETRVSWEGVQEEENSHASHRERELADLAMEMAGMKEPDQSSSASTGFDLNKRQTRELQRSDWAEARESPENLYEEGNTLFEQHLKKWKDEKPMRERKQKEKEERDPFDENYTLSDDENWRKRNNRDFDSDEDYNSSGPRSRVALYPKEEEGPVTEPKRQKKRIRKETGGSDDNNPHGRKGSDSKTTGDTDEGDIAGGDPELEEEGQVEDDFQELKLDRFLTDPLEGGVLSGKKRNVEDYGTDSETERRAEKMTRSKKEEKIMKEKKTRRTEKSQSSYTGALTEATTSQELQETVEGNSVTQPLFQKGVGGQWGGVRENPTTTTIDTPHGNVNEASTVLMNEKNSSQPPPRETIGDRSEKQSVTRVATSLLNPLGLDKGAIMTRRATRSLGETDQSTNPNEDVTTIDKGVASQVEGGNSAIAMEGIASAIDNPLTKNIVYRDTVPVFEIDTVVTEESTGNSMEPLGTGENYVATGLGNSHEIRVEPIINVVGGIVGTENLTVTLRPLGEGSSEDERKEEGENESVSPRLKYPDPAGGRLHKVLDEDTGEIARKKNVSKKNKKGAKGPKGKKGPKSADA